VGAHSQHDTLSGMRLLVVEDEARLATALQRGLQAEGFAVDLAGDGAAGLDLARHGGYDAMILDVMLPSLSGYRVVRTLRAEGNWLPVLMLSAKDGEYDQADGLDSLHLDPARRRVTSDGTEVTLTAREYALLEYLMRRPGEVVSKTELLDHVWDASIDTAPNVVEVYVGYLRRKIGRNLLETVRGAGYRLTVPAGER
jgi:two-component system, OmpR family, response regulator